MLIIAVTIATAMVFFETIQKFIELMNACSCAPLAFTLPALFDYKLEGGNKCHLVITIVTTILAVFMTGLAI